MKAKIMTESSSNAPPAAPKAEAAAKPPAAVALGLEAYHKQSEQHVAEALPMLSEQLMAVL